MHLSRRLNRRLLLALLTLLALLARALRLVFCHQGLLHPEAAEVLALWRAPHQFWSMGVSIVLCQGHCQIQQLGREGLLCSWARFDAETCEDHRFQDLMGPVEFILLHEPQMCFAPNKVGPCGSIMAEQLTSMMPPFLVPAFFSTRCCLDVVNVPVTRSSTDSVEDEATSPPTRCKVSSKPSCRWLRKKGIFWCGNLLGVKRV